MTRSELICVLRAARTAVKREHDMAVFVSWRTATLSRARKIPKLSRLLKSRKRKSAAEQDALRSDIAAAEAEFARLEAQSARGKGTG